MAWEIGTLFGLTSKIWVLFGDGYEDLGFWSGCFGEREADLTTFFSFQIFSFSFKSSNLSLNLPKITKLLIQNLDQIQQAFQLDILFYLFFFFCI